MFYTAEFEIKEYFEDWWDIVVAFVQELPFSSYVVDDHDDKKAFAYTNEVELSQNELQLQIDEALLDLPFSVECKLQAVEKSNWNKEWESNFQPVTIENKLLIRANFHEAQTGFEHEICITPRMSFGTGHHETTYLMCEYVLGENLKGKRVMDAGCGSGILAILAKQRGAAFVEAFDVEDWSVENTVDNAKENNVVLDSVYTGTISESTTTDYDIVLANINRNILLKTMSEMATKIKSKGTMVLSGFYATDVEALVQKAKECDLSLVQQNERNTWINLVLQKK